MTMTFWPGQLGTQWCQPLDREHTDERVSWGVKQGPMTIISDLPSVELQGNIQVALSITKVSVCVWSPEARSGSEIEALHVHWL